MTPTQADAAILTALAAMPPADRVIIATVLALGAPSALADRGPDVPHATAPESPAVAGVTVHTPASGPDERLRADALHLYRAAALRAGLRLP